MRLIDADALSEKLCETTIFIKDGEVFQRMINDAPTVSAEAVQGDGKMIPIELKKRYPHSRDEDITDAFMRGYKSAQAVQGEWVCMIADGTDGSHWYEYECSHCGEVVLHPYNYCPNCGAKMKGAGHETD